MERLTSPNINVAPDTDRFLHAAIGGKEIDWKQCRDSTLNVLINGPTSNGFGKDIFRKMVRDLYGRLKAYEDTGLTPEEIKAPFTEDTMINLAAQALGVETSRLRGLAEADKDGRVVVLPCKVGDGLWTFCSHPVEQVYSFTVTDISTLNGRTLLNTSRCGVMDARDVGKTVFLTREEAKRRCRKWRARHERPGSNPWDD